MCIRNRSEGFKDYFSKYKQPSYSYYTNGIDDVFLSAGAGKEENETLQKPMIVTYAGNIGSGQGLEKIVPQAAKRLGKDYLFRIIGDGGTKLLLQQKMEELQVENVELITVSYTHLRAHETRHDLVCRLLLEKKKKKNK